MCLLTSRLSIPIKGARVLAVGARGRKLRGLRPADRTGRLQPVAEGTLFQADASVTAQLNIIHMLDKRGSRRSENGQWRISRMPTSRGLRYVSVFGKTLQDDSEHLRTERCLIGYAKALQNSLADYRALLVRGPYLQLCANESRNPALS
jgi:hypothetical protein